MVTFFLLDLVPLVRRSDSHEAPLEPWRLRA
jgi:hypothetical protein